ncbi:hypothetical protein GYA93_15730 [Gordonia desulfuricans]|uniref:Uncharacterized protein n=1 Tax=Gordonia desulfuricans TaxID=89051 RepID=A0A7K3LS46_9ACTN|nr:hypothetical protein [Gordonia desulfuricans]NDK91022.1 hypothetical protein [Gordonia desulfuricans]
MTFVIGEVHAINKREPGLIAEDNFATGHCNWVQLLNGNVGAGVVYLDSRIVHESPYSLCVGTGYQSSIGEGTQGYGAAFKRLSRGPVLGKVYAHWKFAYGSEGGENYPRNVDFGLDQCDPDGERRFFKIRWLNYDEATSTRVSKFQVNGDPASTWIDVPGAAIDLGFNEAKRNLFDVEAVFDATTGKYDGLRVNGLGFGTLATDSEGAPQPDATMQALSGPHPHTLNQFKGGMNVGIEVYNRLQVAGSPAWVNLAYFKAVAL